MRKTPSPNIPLLASALAFFKRLRLASLPSLVEGVNARVFLIWLRVSWSPLLERTTIFFSSPKALTNLGISLGASALSFFSLSLMGVVWQFVLFCQWKSLRWIVA